jgi:hypothetical protein
MSEATTDSLIWASSSSLLDPLLLRGAHAHQVGSVAGHVPQAADRRRWHEAGPQQLPLGHLAQPDRVELVGLGPPRQVLDVAGVDQPDLQAVRLQQIEHRLPVVAGGLQHHPGHPQPGQPVGQRQQRAGHRRVGRDLLQPPGPLALAGHPHTAGQLGLADIQRRDPLDELLGVVGLLQHPASLRADGSTARLPAGAARDRRNLIRVLKATVTDPQRGSQRPAVSRPPPITDLRRQRATSPIFTRDRRPSTGTRALLGGCQEPPPPGRPGRCQVADPSGAASGPVRGLALAGVAFGCSRRCCSHALTAKLAKATPKAV